MPQCKQALRDEWPKYRDQALAIASSRCARNTDLATLLEDLDDFDEGCSCSVVNQMNTNGSITIK